MRTCLIAFGILLSYGLFAQQGDELLVYSLKGKVTAVYNNQETVVKIGRVLKPGGTIKTAKGAKVTMVCKQGKPICILKDGSFPLSIWKDSCKYGSGSITSNYFQYIWGELYVRSAEHQAELGRMAGITRDPTPPLEQPVGKDRMILSDSLLGIINYAGNDFSLSWYPNFSYKGNYSFKIYEMRGKKPVYKDSVSGTSISTSAFSKLLKPGKSYRWTVSTRETGDGKDHFIYYAGKEKADQLVASLPGIPEIEEDEAERSFRAGYTLESNHYLYEAYQCYKKSALLNTEMSLFKEKAAVLKKLLRADD